MRFDTENRKLSLVECKKILNSDSLNYTDEEVLKIRDWLYHMMDIAIDAIDKNANTPIEFIDSTEIKNKGIP